MFITGLGIAVPATRYTQRQCWEALRANREYERLTPRSRALMRKVLLGDNGIATRHLALSDLHDAFVLTPDTMHRRFSAHAPALAAEAAENALRRAEIDRDRIDLAVISTCTGYLCPGLSSYIAERLALRSDVLLLDLVGQGCGAALPNLQTCASLLKAGRGARALSICVEVCSAAFYLDDDPGVLISACLFGDGAAAAVLSTDPNPAARSVSWGTAEAFISTEDRDYLRFETRHGLLRNILAQQVPGLAAKHAETVLTRVLTRTGLRREGIAAWILHAGGRDVLHALQERLRLSSNDVRLSAQVLREYGNLSSPFILFVLQAALAEGLRGGSWWLASFGAGFNSHGAILNVE
jgi:alkylresorcinol/alkylpyrone synthase